MAPLAHFDPEHFLREYWQRKPLLLRGAVADFESPLSPEQLAGLALEDAVESRIVEEREGNWQVLHGPFAGADFDRAQPWTLLVQGVDQLLPEVEQLLDLVAFLPRWRIDDVMVSYAVEGGSVGPHYDHYDVFLLQGRGRRSWRLGQRCDSDSPLRPGTELRILADFEPSAEYVLEPGDILYVPPGLAHWGIGHGDCMTYSLGFRAPRLNQLLSRRVDQVLEEMDPDRFYRDPPLSPALRAGEISHAAIDAARKQLLQQFEAAQGPQWFGELVTEPAPDFEQDPDAAGVNLARLQLRPTRVERIPGARLAWCDWQGQVLVFANGATLHTDAASRGTLALLCQPGALLGDELAAVLASAQTRKLLEQLTEAGCIDVE